MTLPQTISELLNAENSRFYDWESEKLGNQLFIDDPDRAERIYNASFLGEDGSFHFERVEDIAEFALLFFDEKEQRIMKKFDGKYQEKRLGELDRAREKITEELKELEQWHIEQGTYSEQVG